MFIGIHAVDESTVWAAGSAGRVVRSSDGGETWSTMFVSGADSVQFRDVHAFDDMTAYVLSIGNGTDSRIYKTSDGGENWELSFQNEDENAFFDCFSFWTPDNGFAFSDSFEGEFTLIKRVLPLVYQVLNVDEMKQNNAHRLKQLLKKDVPEDLKTHSLNQRMMATNKYVGGVKSNQVAP